MNTAIPVSDYAIFSINVQDFSLPAESATVLDKIITLRGQNYSEIRGDGRARGCSRPQSNRPRQSGVSHHQTHNPSGTLIRVGDGTYQLADARALAHSFVQLASNFKVCPITFQ
jgi:hypothetical protein